MVVIWMSEGKAEWGEFIGVNNLKTNPGGLSRQDWSKLSIAVR